MKRLSLPLALLLLACTTTQQAQRRDWRSDDVIHYRIITRDDFQSPTSNKLWGNVAHGAEVCVNIIPDDERYARFQAVLKRECSYWNDVIGTAARLGAVAANALFGIPMPYYGRIPPEYVLQHEQIHFTIMEVQARRLTQAVAKDPTNHERTQTLRRKVLERAQELHAELDTDTGGKNASNYDALESWVDVMERNMRRWCGRGPECQVRTAGWE